MAPAIAADAKIPCPTPQHLREELDTLTWALEPEEKEDTWEKFERAILRFSAVTRGGGYKHTDIYVEGVGRSGIGKKIVKCMLSDRGRLSGVSTDLLQTFAPRLSSNFKPLVNLYLEPLIDLLGRPNKVFLKRAEKCLLTIISNCQIITILPELRRGLNDNAATCRRGSAIAVEKAIKDWPMEIWTERYLTLLEESVKKMATDKDPEVRQTSRRVWALFMEYWPERIEEFSAPLTPTVRRYLDLPAGNGAGPSKPKAKAPARPPQQPTRSASGASTASSHAPASDLAAAAPPRPQHHRVNALATRPTRPPIQHPSAPPAMEAGPSKRRSPRKEPIHLPAAPEEEEEERRPPQPTLSRSTSSSNRLNHDLPVPPALGRHGRSASHNVLPSSSSSMFSLNEENRHNHNPLSKPSRPPLHAAHTAPPEAFDVVQPPRRFAPPARILRVIPTDEEGGMEIGDHPFTTPSGATVFRGPQRVMNAGLGRRGNALGQAHRRVVTAPTTISEEGYFTKTPGRPMGGLGRKKYIDEDQDNDAESPVKNDQNNVIGEIPQAFASPMPTQVVSMDSPLMPILIRSASGNVRAEEDESDMIDLKEDVYPASPLRESNTEEEERKIIEVARGIELPDSPAKVIKEIKPEVPEVVEVSNEGAQSAIKDPKAMEREGQELREEKVEEEESELREEEVEEIEYRDPISRKNNFEIREEQPIEQASHEDHPLVETNETETDNSSLPVDEASQKDQLEKPISKPPQVDQSTTAAPTQIAPEPIKTKSTAPATTATEATAKAASGTAKPKVIGATTRKPPIPSARTATARAVSAPVVRKAFKPTSLSAPTAASAARAASIAKPALATTAVSKSSIATSTTARVPTSNPTISAKSSRINESAPAKPSTAPTATARARVVSAQIAPKPEPKHEPKVSTKPPLPPLARPAAPRNVSGPKKPVVTFHVTLPPVKKDKVTRKAPLPSFRPTRGNATASGTASLKASTSSITAGRAKVKPEMIQLPASPSKPSAVPLPPSPHEVPLPHSPLSRAPSVLSSISRNTSKPSPLKVEIRARVRQDSIVSAPHSPVRMAPIKPLSPLLTTAENDNVDVLPTPPVFALSQKQVENQFNGPSVSTNTSDPFTTSSALTPLSKSSNETTVDAGDKSTDTDDDLGRISFKAISSLNPNSLQPISARTASPSKSVYSENCDIVNSSTKPAFGSRSDVSTPSSKAMSLLSKLEGNEKGMNLAMSFTAQVTPTSERERRALSVKDTNTNTNVGLNSSGSGESDWDVSA